MTACPNEIVLVLESARSGATPEEVTVEAAAPPSPTMANATNRGGPADAQRRHTRDKQQLVIETIVTEEVML